MIDGVPAARAAVCVDAPAVRRLVHFHRGTRESERRPGIRQISEWRESTHFVRSNSVRSGLACGGVPRRWDQGEVGDLRLHSTSSGLRKGTRASRLPFDIHRTSECPLPDHGAPVLPVPGASASPQVQRQAGRDPGAMHRPMSNAWAPCRCTQARQRLRESRELGNRSIQILPAPLLQLGLSWHPTEISDDRCGVGREGLRHDPGVFCQLIIPSLLVRVSECLSHARESAKLRDCRG